ncbi:MAG: hypothetical protein IBX57_00075 [Gammaproteobacteria bacterium]|nr:hypothetical protein [Gammaproteobacteria bacterium]
MNAIDNAITDLKFKIPQAILERAFVNEAIFGSFVKRTPISIDYLIREQVIEPRVMKDLNLVGGQEVTIPLKGIIPEYTMDNKTLWRIPMAATENRRISRVYSLVIGSNQSPTTANMYNQGASAIEDATAGLMMSHLPIPNISHHDIRLVGENTVLANINHQYAPNLHLRCVLENDAELNNLTPGILPKFSKLVELAVKSYIYNKLIIQIDQAQLSGGQELGRFSSIVEEYSDAEEMYQEYFEETWRKMAVFGDKEAYKRHLKRITGGRF